MPDTTPAAMPQFICPYCGGATPDQPRCASCNGLLDPLSRQATQNAMGPWFVRDDQQPHRPGCSYETIVALISRGKITPESIVRSPTTAQFWYPAKRVPGVANRLGVCHACQTSVGNESSCPTCHVSFEVEGDRQTLGLMPIRMIPGAAQEVSAPAARAAVASPPVAPAPAAESRLAAVPDRRGRNSAMLGASLGLVIVVGVVLSLLLISERGRGASAEMAPSASEPSVPIRERGVAPSTETSRGGGATAAAAITPSPTSVASAPIVNQPDNSAAARPVNPDLEILRRTRLP